MDTGRSEPNSGPDIFQPVALCPHPDDELVNLGRGNPSLCVTLLFRSGCHALNYSSVCRQLMHKNTGNEFPFGLRREGNPRLWRQKACVYRLFDFASALRCLGASVFRGEGKFGSQQFFGDGRDSWSPRGSDKSRYECGCLFVKGREFVAVVRGPTLTRWRADRIIGVAQVDGSSREKSGRR